MLSAICGICMSIFCPPSWLHADSADFADYLPTLDLGAADKVRGDVRHR